MSMDSQLARSGTHSGMSNVYLLLAAFRLAGFVKASEIQSVVIYSIAFLTYAVSDIKAARHFYEDILGLKLTHEAGGEWFEYDIGDTTFAISAADAEHPMPVRSAVLAFEVSDLDAEVARLQQRGATFRQGINETPGCRFAIVLDPDGSEIILHQRKTPHDPSV